MKGHTADTDLDVLSNSICWVVFPELLLMSLSDTFTSHFGFLSLNYMKMELPLITQSS